MVPGFSLVPAYTVRVALALPPAIRLTLPGLAVQTVHNGLGHNGEGEETVTVPLKPLMLVNVIVDVAEVPAVMFSD